MHPHVLDQLAHTLNDELRQCAARISATRVARPARRWPRWLRRTTTASTGGRLVRDRHAIAIGSRRLRTATNTQSVKR